MKDSMPLLECQNLCKYFPISSGFLRKNVGQIKALEDVSFQVGEKEIVGIIGESGSGKTTLARSVMRLEDPTSGQILFDSVDITHMSQSELRPMRKSFQVVFQNPASSLNPRMTIAQSLDEVILFHQMLDDVAAYSHALMKKVGLQEEYLARYPHELSIGQQQRVCIARALVTSPRLLILDECVSALDISVQAQVLNLLLELYEELGLSYIFISHDIAVVEHMADTILVMNKGEIVEQGPAEQVLNSPTHPYTRLLLSSALPSEYRS
ncbi:MAG: ATP-binding cassette domain-containing protein [Chlamydiales bacterium]|nr:ATP-binding cassette domain-containing protein [Chlamydiales bacterium]